MSTGERGLILIWFLIAAALGVCLAVASLDRRPLDDPDLVFQRPGFLDARGSPFSAPELGEDLPSRGTRLVVFFVRREQIESLQTALQPNRRLGGRADAVVIVAAEHHLARRRATVLWLDDFFGTVASEFRMPVPRDGGPPVGYAIVDTAGRVRYRTLDPTMTERLKEVETMLKATP